MKAIKRYLIGNDGGRRYRILMKDGHKAILSRNVQFQEKLRNFAELIKLTLSLAIRLNEKSKKLMAKIPKK